MAKDKKKDAKSCCKGKDNKGKKKDKKKKK